VHFLLFWFHVFSSIHKTTRSHTKLGLNSLAPTHILSHTASNTYNILTTVSRPHHSDIHCHAHFKRKYQDCKIM